MGPSLASAAFDRYECFMGRWGAILGMCLLGGCSSQQGREQQAPEAPSTVADGDSLREAQNPMSANRGVPLSEAERPRLHFPLQSSQNPERVGFELVPLPGQEVSKFEFDKTVGEPLFLPEVPIGKYRLELLDEGLWMETRWVTVQGSDAWPIGDVFVYPVSAPCYWGARVGQDCFVFDATRAEVMRIGYRSASGFRVWTDVQTRDERAALQRIEHVHFRDAEEGPSAKRGEIVVGPGTTEDWVEQALTWTEQMHLEHVTFVQEPAPPPVEARALRVVPKSSLGSYQARLFSLLPELGGCFAHHQVEQEIHVEVRFSGGAPHEVALTSGVPAPPVPSCTEYDEDMGRCSRALPPHPDALLNRAWLSCLERELRALRVEGDEAWSFVLRPEGSGEKVGKSVK